MRRLCWAGLAAATALTACSTDDAPDRVSAATTSTAPEPGELVTATSPESSGPTGSPAPQPVVPSPELPSLEGIDLRLAHLADFDQPVDMVTRSGTPDLYIAEKSGRVERLAAIFGVWVKAPTPVLDLRSQTADGPEQGLLGIEFSSDGRRLFASYTDNAGDSRIVEYQMDDHTADPSSRRTLLRVDQPYPNHNGGHITRGPDGFLWIGLGDGGSAGDPEENGENPETLLGSILRIDPDRPSGFLPYGIPESNPFADGEGGALEVWLHGVRNPWRFSFDAQTGDLWVGDVGQSSREEITLLPAAGGLGRGADLGWDRLEGTQLFEGPEPASTVAPLIEYSHDEGCSVTGGHVYRGMGFPVIQGVYFFADHCAPGIRAAVTNGTTLVETRTFDLPISNVVAFAEAHGNELYVLSQDGGIHQLVATGPEQPAG